MTFMQLIEYETSKPDEVRKVTEEWQKATAGKRTAKRIVVSQDRDDPKRYYELVFFDSYEAAMENSELAETQEYAAKMKDLLDGEPTYVDLDVVEDQKL